MYYVYILLNLKTKRFYTGYTRDLKSRLIEHKNKKVYSTKKGETYILIYYEACLNKYDAVKRERYLKSGPGKKYLKNRLKNYLKNKL